LIPSLLVEGVDAGLALAFPNVGRQRAALADRGHRPWPLPPRPWVMGQTWFDLAFLHWRVPLEPLQRVVPSELPIDRFDGDCWVGVTPFTVAGLRLHGTPPPPLVSRFHELNVRTYVTVAGRPGIYFFSLDAASSAAVAAARRIYRLPYFSARMSAVRRGAWINYESERADGPPATFAARYRPAGERLPVAEGSLERWLSERYCLYTLDERRRVLRGEIHHPPWPLEPGEAELTENTMTEHVALPLEGEPLVHFSARQDVVFWRLAPA
jgi:uncharacterized protein YqjF (DUF2071 family)